MMARLDDPKTSQTDKDPAGAKFCELVLQRKPIIDRLTFVDKFRRLIRTDPNPELRGPGVGHGSMEKRDEIWMLHGGEVTIVLLFNTAGQSFQLIRERYLHGFVFREKLQEDPSTLDRLQTVVLV